MRVEYVVGEAATNLKRNVLLALGAVLAVFVSLLMTYMALIVGEVIRTTTIQWSEGVTIIGWLNDADLADHASIQGEVLSWDEVEDARYVSKTDAYVEFQDIFGETQPRLVEEMDASALPASVRIVLADPEAHSVVFSRLERTPGINDVDSPSEALEQQIAVSRALNTGAIILGAVLGVSAIVMISNTVRMAIYARREEIGIMKLVGASNWFVRTPFLVEGLIEGLVGGILAVVVGWLGYQGFLRNLDIGVVNTELPSGFLLSRGMIILFTSGVAGVVGSLIGLRRYLRE